MKFTKYLTVLFFLFFVSLAYSNTAQGIEVKSPTYDMKTATSKEDTGFDCTAGGEVTSELRQMSNGTYWIFVYGDVYSNTVNLIDFVEKHVQQDAINYAEIVMVIYRDSDSNNECPDKIDIRSSPHDTQNVTYRLDSLGRGDDVVYAMWIQHAIVSVYGGGGNDRVYAGNGHNFFDGGDGNDVFSAGLGTNDVHFGRGADIFQGKDGGGVSYIYLGGNDSSGSPDFVRLYCHKNDSVVNIDTDDGDDVRGYEAKDCPNKKELAPTIRRY